MSSPHNPWPDGIVHAADLPEPEPQTALARWDSAEAHTGRKLQPLTEDGRLQEFVAWGGVSKDLRPDAPVVTGLGMRVTKYNEDGTLGETAYFPDARVSVTMRDVDLEEDSAVKRLVRAWGPPIAQLAITFTATVGPACRALLDALTGLRPASKGKGTVRPCKGLTRRQRAARRRIHRRKIR